MGFISHRVRLSSVFSLVTLLSSISSSTKYELIRETKPETLNSIIKPLWTTDSFFNFLLMFDFLTFTEEMKFSCGKKIFQWATNRWEQKSSIWLRSQLFASRLSSPFSNLNNTLCWRGLEYADYISCCEAWLPQTKRGVLSMILHWIWLWGFNSVDIGLWIISSLTLFQALFCPGVVVPFAVSSMYQTDVLMYYLY